MTHLHSLLALAIGCMIGAPLGYILAAMLFAQRRG